MTGEAPEGKEQYMSFAMAAIQRATIDKLRKDNESLKEELFLENKFSFTPTDNIAAHRIACLQDEADALTRKIQLEQRKVALAEMESKQLAEKLGSHQEVIKLAGGFSSATDRAVALHKEIKRRESRRQQASIKFNEAVTHCRKLRTQIDSLRRERLVFDGLHGKLDRDVQERKREMAKVIEATNRAAEARERCAAEMAALKAQADREQAAFESEWQRLGAAIDQDRRNRELLRQRDMEERNRKTQELLKNREEALTAKAAAKGKEGRRARQRTDDVESMDRVQLLGEAFQKIQAATGITEIDELIERFKAADDRNYTLLAYVNELNQEVAKLEEQVRAIEREMESAQAAALSRAGARARAQHEMEERLHSTEGLAATFEARLEAAQRTVGALKEGVQGLAAQAGCGTRAVRELLGDGGVTEQNVLQYVSVVEQRVAEVLRVYSGALSRAGRDSDHLQVLLGQAAPPHDATRVAIQPPSTADEEYDDMDAPADADDEGAEPRPLGQEALQAKVAATLRRRGAGAIFRVPEHSRRKGGGGARASAARA